MKKEVYSSHCCYGSALSCCLLFRNSVPFPLVPVCLLCLVLVSLVTTYAFVSPVSSFLCSTPVFQLFFVSSPMLWIAFVSPDISHVSTVDSPVISCVFDEIFDFDSIFIQQRNNNCMYELHHIN